MTISTIYRGVLRKPIHSHGWLFFLFACAYQPVLGAQFSAEASSQHGAWTASLYRNLSNRELFCAAETQDGQTDFRINRYKSSGETFIELFNPNWSMMKGDVRFTLDFIVEGGGYAAELRGQSWGDSYTHDFTDEKNYHALLGLISQSKSFKLKNTNNAVIGTFSSAGALAALQEYVRCVEA